MKKYRIYTGRYGGEVTIGKVTEDFFNYTKENDLEEIVSEMGWVEEEDQSWPRVTEEYADQAWHDVDDCLHISGPYADNQYTVFEISETDDEVSVGTYDYNQFYSRECYMNEEHDPEDAESIPVLTCFSEEKGGFGEITLELEEDFDPDLFACTVVETHFAEIIESYYYDGKELDVDWDYADTTGKAFYSATGYISKHFEYANSERTQKWLMSAIEEHFEHVHEDKKTSDN